jgi:hypothetical protein
MIYSVPFFAFIQLLLGGLGALYACYKLTLLCIFSFRRALVRYILTLRIITCIYFLAHILLPLGSNLAYSNSLLYYGLLLFCLYFTSAGS